MFPTFSGNSRRPRNVNMSGQKNLNPFAATSWTPNSSSTASKTVADAQAERNRRQHEREKLKAAQSIQKTWRGHAARSCLKDKRRETLDALYGDLSRTDPRTRAAEALPLVVAALDPRLPDDRTRLGRFAQDLLQSDCSLVKSQETASGSQIRRLTKQLLVLLQSSGYDQVHRSDLEVVIQILSTRFESARDNLDSLFEIIANYCRNEEIRDAESLSLLEQAILVPIAKDHERRASNAFALCFLTQPNLKLFEGNVGAFAERIDTEKVSAGIVEAYAAGWASKQQTDARLWLLAHFIALGNATRDSSLGPSYLHALYIQLSSLHTELKKYHIGHTTTDSANTKKRLPPFIEKAIQSLVEKDEITHVLERFTTNFAGSSQEESDEASLLAAYILTLIRCFPALSDDIRMRLYLADIPSHPNSVKFFWNAMARTKIFLSIVSDERGSTLDLLQGRGSKHLKDDAVWDREWRTILLFLELYVFVLRLTDDEDFFFPLGSAKVQTLEVSRLRQCMLDLEELKSLTLFLRNLAFTLYYHANDLRQHVSRHASRANKSVQDLFGSQEKAPQETSTTNETYSVVSGVDFDTFRGTVTQAMRMVYERDSRRGFLPRDHWLMTSRFDMEGFKSAVVAEDQRQRELQDAESDDEDINFDDDSDSDEQDAYITSAYTTQAARNARLERMRAAHKQEQRKLQAATVAPKLEILRNMPFVIPFDTRVKIFRDFVYLDKIRRRDGHVEADQWRMSLMHTFREPQRAREVIGRHTAKVRRGRVFEDAYEQFYELQDGLKEPIQITFVDQFDIPEAGIDGGGVTKEFLMSATTEAFSDEHGLFVANSQNSLYPNPCAVDQRQTKLRETGLTPDSQEWRESMSNLLEQYEFLGRIIGKCLYEGILIDVVFAGFFLLKWAASASDAGYRANINDLRELDQDLYANMMKLKNYPGDVSELGLDFTIDDQISMPDEPVRIATRKLAPDGDKMTVTNENKLLYINYVARHRLVAQPSRVTRAFLQGLGAIIEPAWLSMFNQTELQRLVGGDSTEIDLEDLRRHTIYSGLYQIGDDGEEHPVIKMFWELLHRLPDRNRRAVLKYVTSTPRAPLLGFGQLKPAFSIRDGGSDPTRLPSASTCVNLLKLPMYRTVKEMEEKLLYAVLSGAGFDLS